MAGPGSAPRAPGAGILRLPAAAAAWMRGAWRRLRAWRRIRFTAGGTAFTLGAFAVGFAAVNTGNNLLYLLLGAMLGFIGVSGWLSERAVRGLSVSRKVPRGVTVGRPVRIEYRVTNHKGWLPSYAVDLSEEGLPRRAFVPFLPAGSSTVARSLHHFTRRGVYPLHALTLGTGFPFGLFRKERDLSVPGELVIWPRTDRSVREVEPAGGRRARRGAALTASPGGRGEYRGLREYRPGDDPRDIHWRTTARLSAPVVREYERDAAEDLEICLDLRGEPGGRAEAAVEIAAALAARALRTGRRFGLTAHGVEIPPDSGAGHLERVLDALARIDVRPDAPPPPLPADPAACVLVAVSVRERRDFGDVLVPGPGEEAE